MNNNIIKEGERYEGTIEFSTNKHASINIDDKPIFIFKKNTKNALHLDKVIVEVFKGEKKLEAKVVDVISRNKKEFVGRVHINGKLTFVVPDSNRIPTDFYIKGGLKSEDNQKVIVELTKWEDSKSPQAKIVKILGDMGENNAEMNSIMYEYGLPVDFPQDVINESELVPEVISEKEIKSRRDMRDVTTITIDPVDARDFDDALSLKVINDNNFEIGVHIADVSHYVIPDTKLDEEAYERATSVYLVDRCVPMLPERLSNGICSLKPNEDRLAFSVVFNMDSNGRILKEWHGKTVIHSDKRFAYEDAQEIIEGNDTSYTGEDRVYPLMVNHLNQLAQKIRKKRIKDGSIEMGGIEVRFKLAEDDKKPIGVYFKEQKEANKLIEEFMLLANKSVAKLLSSNSRTNVFRVHDTPNMEKLTALSNVCRTFGHEFKLEGESEDLKKSINELLRDVKGTPEENMISTIVTRCMSKATYTIQNIGHYGLGFTHYSHFTSPIRRYPDLMTHRMLFDFLNKKKQGNPTKIEEEAKWCSSRELIASRAQRDSIKYKQAEYLLDKIGKVFSGIVSGVTDWGLYVELTESKCEGMIRYQSLEGNYHIDTNNYQIYNDFGDRIRLGDPINIIVSGVDLDKKQIDFTRM
jgi:ribonuclease R